MDLAFLAPIIDYVRHGGVMMLPIIAVSLAMWWFILLKFQELAAAERREMAVVAAVSLAAAAREPETAGTPLRRVVAGFVSRRAAGDRRVNAALLASLVERERERLAAGLDYIYVLATVAPLLGLLGTVGGMIGTFDAIAVFGTGNARAMAGGISRALITTQSGLFVSLPGLFMASLLQRRLGRVAARLEEFRTAMVRKMAAAGSAPVPAVAGGPEGSGR